MLLLLVLSLLFIFLFLKYYNIKSKESFTVFTDKNYGIHNGYDNIYDDFYSFLYYKIYVDSEYYIKICKILLQYSNRVYNNNLIIGIKNGGHINELLKKNVESISISKSPSIINLCYKNYPNNSYILTKDYDKNHYLFSENEFTHISIIDNELYYLRDIRSIFYNCNKWLIHKGYFLVQIHNNMKSLKKNFFKINSNIKYNYNYSYDFKNINDKNYRIVETIYNNKKKRINHHIITFHDINYIKYISKEFGFKYVNAKPINKDETILIFQKL